MVVQPVPLMLLAVLALLPQAITGQLYGAAAPELAGALGLSLDEASAFRTLNMTAQLMALPLAAWLAIRMGDRALLRLAALTGLVSALVGCLWLQPWPQLLAWGGHGLSASGLLLMAHRLVLRHLGFRAIAWVEGAMLLIVVLLPMSVYPGVLAHLAEEGLWPWVFAIQLPVFALLLFRTRFWPWPAPDDTQVIGFNWLQALLLSGLIACLTFLLLRGERYNWFRDPDIAELALITLALGVLTWLAFSRLWGRGEYLRVGVMASPHGKVAMLDAAVAGFMILGTNLLIGNLVAGGLGYSHAQLGWLELISLPGMLVGLAVALFMTVNPARDPERIVPVGVVMIFVAAVLLAGRSGNSGMADLWLPLLIKGLAIGLLNISITIHILRRFPREQVTEGIVWFYLFRTAGSLLSITEFSRMMTLESRHALARLGERYNAAGEVFAQQQQAAAELLRRFTGQAAPEQVAALLGRRLQEQVVTVAGVNNFQWLLLTMALLVPLMVGAMKWAHRHDH